MLSSKKVSASAAKLIDSKLQGIAETVDSVSTNLQSAGLANESVQRFAGPTSTKLDGLASKLREQDGEQLVQSAKNQMLAHPKTAIGAAAVAGAIIAQAALTAIRAEQKETVEAELEQID